MYIYIYIHMYIYIYPYVFIIYSIISHEISRSADDLRGLLNLRSLFRFYIYRMTFGMGETNDLLEFSLT